MTSRAIKALATTLLKHRDGYLVTRADILNYTARRLYDRFIKPLGKYGGTKIVSRFGIDEEVWKAVQEEIRGREITDEERKVDEKICATIEADMRAAGVLIEER